MSFLLEKNNNLETIIGYLGFIKSNCVTTLIDEKTNDYFLLNIISKYKPHYIFISNTLTELFFASVTLGDANLIGGHELHS